MHGENEAVWPVVFIGVGMIVVFVGWVVWLMRTWSRERYKNGRYHG